MTLVAYARYVTVTGDTSTASATVVEALADAQALLEDELGRVGMLEDDTVDKVERLKLYPDGILGSVVYPSGIPITDPGEFTTAGASLVGASADGGPFVWAGQDGDVYATVTYQGGYTAATVPACIARDIAWAAHALCHQLAMTAVPAGATSVSLGDASVTYATPQAPSMTGVAWSSATLRHRRRRL